MRSRLMLAIGLSVLMAALLACPAAAAPKQDTFALTFQQIDQNGDGSIVLTELVALFPKGGKELYRLMDRDRDGKVSEAEWQAWRKKYADQEPAAFAVRHVVLDQDHDGNVTAQEFVAMFGPEAKKAFDKADGNHDGKLSKDEWMSWLHGK